MYARKKEFQGDDVAAVETAIHTDQKRTEGTKKTLRKSQTDELSITLNMQEIILRGVL